MHKVINSIHNLFKYTSDNYYPSNLKIKIIELNYLANVYKHEQDQDYIKKIRNIIFNLLEIIPKCKTIDINFIMIFSELIINFMDEESKQENDITDLIKAFDKISVSFNLTKSLSNLKI